MDISGEFIDLSGSFAENLVLLLIAIGLTGFLIPLLLKGIDARRDEGQARLQADLARQDKVIDAQAAVLDTLAALLWDYQRIAADVIAGHSQRTGSADRYAAAVHAYETEAAALLGKTRAAISTLLRLAPRGNYEAFLQLFSRELLPFDRCLSELTRQQAALGESRAGEQTQCAMPGTQFAGASWEELRRYLQEDLAEQVDRAIAELADGMSLDRDAKSSAPRP